MAFAMGRAKRSAAEAQLEARSKPVPVAATTASATVAVPAPAPAPAAAPNAFARKDGKSPRTVGEEGKEKEQDEEGDGEGETESECEKETGRKKKKSRYASWTESAELTLAEVRTSVDLLPSFESGNSRKASPAWDRVVQTLKEKHGLSVNTEQCQTKWRSMVKKYEADNEVPYAAAMQKISAYIRPNSTSSASKYSSSSSVIPSKHLEELFAELLEVTKSMSRKLERLERRVDSVASLAERYVKKIDPNFKCCNAPESEGSQDEK